MIDILEKLINTKFDKIFNLITQSFNKINKMAPITLQIFVQKAALLNSQKLISCFTRWSNIGTLLVVTRETPSHEVVMKIFPKGSL
jgi:hypothetical protein